jgi:hypothetical protein
MQTMSEDMTNGDDDEWEMHYRAYKLIMRLYLAHSGIFASSSWLLHIFHVEKSRREIFFSGVWHCLCRAYNKINLWCRKALNFPLKLICIWSVLACQSHVWAVRCSFLFKLTLTCIFMKRETANTRAMIWKWFTDCESFIYSVLQLLSVIKKREECIRKIILFYVNGRGRNIREFYLLTLKN